MRIAFAGLVGLTIIFFAVLWQRPDPWTPITYPDGRSGEVVWGPPVSSLEQCREWLGEFQPDVEAECGEDCIYDMENGVVVCDRTVGAAEET